MTNLTITNEKLNLSQTIFPNSRELIEALTENLGYVMIWQTEDLPKKVKKDLKDFEKTDPADYLDL